MLRVAHVLNAPGRGGVPRVVHALVRHADRARIAPHVFYLNEGAGADLFADMDIPRRAAQGASKAVAMMELVSFLDRHHIDLLHTHSFRPNLYGRMAGAVLRPAGLKVIAHYHNDYSDKWTGDATLLERRLAAVTDAGLAVSGAVADHVARRVGMLCEVAENGIDRDRVTGGNRTAGRNALGLSADDFAVGLIGRICRQKGVDTFVAAACKCLPDLPGLRFVVVGEAEDPVLMADLSARVRRAALSDRIGFAGHREDIADVLAALDLLAAPSRWEGFGLMLAEAMAAGVPVVASDVGGIPGVLGTAGHIISADDPNRLATAVTGLMRNPARRKAMVAAGLEQSARFDWCRTASRVAEVYDRIGGLR